MSNRVDDEPRHTGDISNRLTRKSQQATFELKSSPYGAICLAPRVRNRARGFHFMKGHD